MAKRIKIKGTAPSSTRKKLVKEGNQKFIGPRTQKSEDAEKYGDLTQHPGMRSEHFYKRDKKKTRAPEENRWHRELAPALDDEHAYGRGGISKSKRLKMLLARLMDRHLGGGQEFDRQD
jgi:hypothetical protein